MLFALGAASSAIDALKALTSSKPSAQTTGFSQDASNPFESAGTGNVSAGAATGSSSGGCSPISADTMSALLAAQGQSSGTAASSSSTGVSDPLKDLFSQIDADGDGRISKSEFENALGAGGTNLAQADDVFSKLDKNGDSAVSLDEMSSALKGGKGGGHHHHHVAAGDLNGKDGSSSDPLLQALDGASSSAVSNADGSTTTTLTYGDGSKVTLTSAAQASPSGAATSSYNFIEQLIQRQATAISAAAATGSLSISA